jgi:hypothetical protein
MIKFAIPSTYDYPSRLSTNGKRQEQRSLKGWFLGWRLELLFVTVLLLFASALRIIGIAYGQPAMSYHPTDAVRNTLPLEVPIHPDEYFYVAIPMQMVVNGDFEPHFYENPSFLINLNALTYWLTGAGQGQTPDDFKGISQRQFAPFPLYIIGRFYSILGGLLAIAATYAAARLIAGRYAAAAAGLLVTVSLPMVQHAHYATTSSLAAGFTAVALWASFASLKTGRLYLLAIAGSMAGFAISNRYNVAAIILIVIGVGTFLIYRDRRIKRPVLLSWMLVPISFLISTPGALTDFRQFWSDFTFIVRAYAAGGQLHYATHHGLFFEYRYLILFSLGAPAALAVLFGLQGLVRSRLLLNTYSSLHCVILIVGYLFAYSIVVLRTVRPGHSDQLLVPVIPAFAVLAGMGIDWIYNQLPISKTVLAPALISILIVIPLVLSLQVVQIFSLLDTRLMMQTWIYEKLPPGSRIHLAGPYNVPLDPAIYPSTQDYAGQHTSLDQLQANGVDYVIVSDAELHDTERSREIVPSELLREVQVNYAEYAVLPIVAHIDRPQWTGYDWMMHTATIWHHPGLTIYCVRCSY